MAFVVIFWSEVFCSELKFVTKLMAPMSEVMSYRTHGTSDVLSKS